jgi:hypothetical protein
MQPDAIGDLHGRPTNYLGLIVGRDVPAGTSTPLRRPANIYAIWEYAKRRLALAIRPSEDSPR